jgi:quercetin dioxygenase-like cupin family protein
MPRHSASSANREANGPGSPSFSAAAASRSRSIVASSTTLPTIGVCETSAMPEAPVRMSKNGLVVDEEGWFVVNARESRWRDEGPLGAYCTFEGKRRFPHFGFNISVFEPGQRMGMYHRENAQEAFLVLSGECTLIVEGEERVLREWDFFFCEPGTEHIIVTGEGQSAIVVAVGARGRGVGGGLVYTACKKAARYGASVARETAEAAKAYADVWASLPRSRFVKYRGWLD